MASNHDFRDTLARRNSTGHMGKCWCATHVNGALSSAACHWHTLAMLLGPPCGVDSEIELFEKLQLPGVGGISPKSNMQAGK